MKDVSTSRPLRDLSLAVTLLTAVPLPARWPADERPDVAGYFPLAGALLGSVGYVFLALAARLGVPGGTRVSLESVMLAVLLVTMWAMLTRMLHWDALADVADAYWGAHEPSMRLEIASDPHVGAFGVAGIVLVALVQVAALSLLIANGFLVAVAVAVVIARYAALFGAWLGSPAKQTGLGAVVAGRPRPASVVAATLVFLATLSLSWASGPGAFAAVVVCLVVALGVPHVLASRFGGITGDVLGASILLTETASLAILAWVR
ncbi:MAG: adenosylcobinamide-GDP ribazoletransferase [Anaerosomatales bacterium]|nr:adenosylcobinamide-GDP ribazoletransferase [Anaerosomatales bacterium]MDT8433478.1 adenosylcobinamide-GDP ribazoletransferase [Anaerosomatales bacterium]